MNMRKITSKTVLGRCLASCLALCTMGGLLMSIPATAATITANVNANISGAIAASASSGLAFGDVSPGISAGTVTIDVSGFRSSAGGVTLGLSSPFSPAIFLVSGTPSSSYAITSPGTLSLSNGIGNFMTVDGFATSPNGTGLLDSSGTQTLKVGGTLHVNANQPGGSYTGVLAMTIVYN
jgi:hypothetical protein